MRKNAVLKFEINNIVINCRIKDGSMQTLGAVETKLLYTLHWIILDAAEECAGPDYEKGIIHTSPFYYLFSIPTITVSYNYDLVLFFYLYHIFFIAFRIFVCAYLSSFKRVGFSKLST